MNLRGLYCVLALLAAPLAQAAEETCARAAPGDKALLFGDLHVHTAFSLDAYAFGAIATPREAYSFARGQSLRLANGELVSLERPLDFAAVTDHAETWEITYSCTDPLYADIPYCQQMRALRDSGDGRGVFVRYLLPVVTAEPPVAAPFCDTLDCAAANVGQWRRVREAADDANEPCAFTALIGYEWTATPGGRHWHRNVIFRSNEVPSHAFDYIRYPSVGKLWSALAEHCRPDAGCDAIAIPHNLNWTDGGTFDVENDSPDVATLRARYERLAEMHQEKGSSECLPATRDGDRVDCGFELLPENSAKTRMSGPATDPDAEWRAMRSGYYRTLLGRGLAAYEDSNRRINPLQLGAIGSTDGHFGAAGFTEESTFNGGVYAIWADPEALLANPVYNPGGLVAVWAEENTRAAVFDALKRREAYATSGTRIRLKFGATAPDACDAAKVRFDTPMGGTTTAGGRTFTVQAAKDRTPLAAIDIVKGYLVDGEPVENVHRVASFEGGRDTACVTWTDPSEAEGPAYWYARVIELPSPRWSKFLCERLDLCDKYPDADRLVEDRAWSSPVWYLP
ncbi:MAG: DUF3604 domain-containing protein [Pseudomonadales bacterium]